MVTTRNAPKRKRLLSPAAGDQTQGGRRPRRIARHSHVVNQGIIGDENPVVVETRPPHTSIAMVEKLLLDDKKAAVDVVDWILELDVAEKEEIRNECKGTDICANLVHVLTTTSYRYLKVQVCSLFISFTNEGENYFTKKALSVDAPKAIVKAMKQFPDYSLLQERGCGALSNLAATTDKNVVRTFVKAGCIIEVVVAAMRNHPAAFFVQKSAIFCLNNIVDAQPTTSVEMVASLDLVIAAMTNHAETDEIQKYGCKVLIKLSASNEQAKQDIIAKGGGVAAAAAERKYRGMVSAGDIQEEACSLLKCLYP